MFRASPQLLRGVSVHIPSIKWGTEPLLLLSCWSAVISRRHAETWGHLLRLMFDLSVRWEMLILKWWGLGQFKILIFPRPMSYQHRECFYSSVYIKRIPSSSLRANVTLIKLFLFLINFKVPGTSEVLSSCSSDVCWSVSLTDFPISLGGPRALHVS